MKRNNLDAILVIALADRLFGRIPDRTAKTIADLVTEVRELRAEAGDDG